jgi:hypothetical protein
MFGSSGMAASGAKLPFERRLIETTIDAYARSSGRA